MQNTQQSSNENKTNNHKNTDLLQNQSPKTQISNKTTKPINPTTKPISNKVNLNLQTHKSFWETNTKKKKKKKIGSDTHRKNKPKPPKFSGKLTKLLVRLFGKNKKSKTLYVKTCKIFYQKNKYKVFYKNITAECLSYPTLSQTLLILSHTCPNQ